MKKKALLISLLFIGLVSPGTAVMKKWTTFEDGSADWNDTGDTSDSFSTTQTTVKEGSYAMNYYYAGSNDRYNWKTKSSNVQTSKITFWFNSEIVSDDKGIISAGDNSQNRLGWLELGDANNNDLQWNHGNGTQNLDSAPSSNTWYKIELYNIDWSNGNYDIALKDSNGNTITSASGLSFLDTPSGFGGFSIGADSGQSYNMYLDNITYQRSNTAPSINSTDYSPDSPVSGDKIDTYMNGSDADGDNISGALSVWRDSTLLNNSASMTEYKTDKFRLLDGFTSEKEGTYTMQFELSDPYTTSYQNRTFTLKDSGAKPEINEPLNQTYGYKEIDWNVTVQDNDDFPGESMELELYKDGNFQENYSVTEGETLNGSFNWTEGSHEFKAKTVEPSGETNTSNVLFQVDKTPPKVDVKTPDGYYNYTKNLPLNYTVDDTSLNSCQYSKDGGTNFSISNCQNTSIDYNTIGEHNVTLWAKDDVGNWGRGSSNFTLDKVSTIKAEKSGTGTPLNNFSLTVTNGTDSLVEYSNNGEVLVKTSNLPKGSAEFTVDKDGYEPKTKNFTLDESFKITDTFSLTQAGVFVETFDEQVGGKLKPLNYTIRNSTHTVELIRANWSAPGSFYATPSSSSIVYEGSQSYSQPDGILETHLAFNVTDTDSTSSSCSPCELIVQATYESGKQKNTTIGLYDDMNDRFLLDDDKKDITKIDVWSRIDSNGAVNADMDDFRWYNQDYDKGQIEAKYPKWKERGFPTGTVFFDVGKTNYVARQYKTTVDQNTKINLDAYLLQEDDGIFITVEVYDENRDSLANADVNIQRNYDNTWKTISHELTNTDGSSSFFLNPETTYRALVTYPGYSPFLGTFSPVDYQYDPLRIQLSKSGTFIKSTVWDEVSYKLDPRVDSFNYTGEYEFNWTVTDSQGELQEVGLRLKNESGTVLKSDRVTGSPSGASVAVTFNASKQGMSPGKDLKIEGYFIREDQEYTYSYTSPVRERIIPGIYSIRKILDKGSQDLDNTTQGLIALIFTMVAGAGLKTRFKEKGAGLITLMVLGFFTLEGWFDPFTWTLTFLTVLGLYGTR